MSSTRRELLKTVPLLTAPLLGDSSAKACPIRPDKSAAKETVLVVKQTTPPSLVARNQICAKVDNRLLQKAPRLFSGNERGVCCELVQNARRAGATKITVRNKQTEKDHWLIEFEDNGHGVHDFGQLLALGFSGWSDDTEAAEDPAGAGFFSLSPRRVIAASRGRQITVNESGWIGAPVNVEESEFQGTGLRLRFSSDQAWGLDFVSQFTKFGGLTAEVDGDISPPMAFLLPDAPVDKLDSELGAWIQVVDASERADEVHQRWNVNWHMYRSPNIVLNFFGQRVGLAMNSLAESAKVMVLVDMSGQPTSLRLKLPDRQAMHEGPGLASLNSAIQAAIYKHLVKRGHHNLPFSDYQAGIALGYALPEAPPQWRYGVGSWDLSGNDISFDNLDKSLPLLQSVETDDSVDRSLDVLADQNPAFGHCMVSVSPGMSGYSWQTCVPTVLDATAETTPLEIPGLEDGTFYGFCGGSLAIVESIRLTLEIEDPTQSDPVFRTFDAPFYVKDDYHGVVTRRWLEECERLAYDVLWAQLGGWHEEAEDSYETMQNEFDEAFKDLLAILQGPYEPARRALIQSAKQLLQVVTGSRHGKIILSTDGTVRLRLHGGDDASVVTLKPPETE